MNYSSKMLRRLYRKSCKSRDEHARVRTLQLSATQVSAMPVRRTSEEDGAVGQELRGGAVAVLLEVAKERLRSRFLVWGLDVHMKIHQM